MEAPGDNRFDKLTFCEDFQGKRPVAVPEAEIVIELRGASPLDLMGFLVPIGIDHNEVNHVCVFWTTEVEGNLGEPLPNQATKPIQIENRGVSCLGPRVVFATIVFSADCTELVTIAIRTLLASRRMAGVFSAEAKTFCFLE